MTNETETTTITSIEFRNYKALPRFSIRLQRMNILVGPNNCGKSTVIGGLRLLAWALKRTRGQQPQYLLGPSQRRAYGYTISDDNVPISIENVHTDYAETDTTMDFRCSNGNTLQMYFPKGGGIVLLTDPVGKDIRTSSAFRHAYPLKIAVVPVLGPLEHEEEVVKEETVQRGLETHRASRHFRNYWRYYPSGFEEFAEMVSKSWPGMEIQLAEMDHNAKLAMFCLENRMTRELYWSGFGFQVWCQLLTHLFRASDSSLVVIDEPEIYLHPDVQRQLLYVLRDLGPDAVIATHSTEMMSEAEPSDILLMDKAVRSAERLRDVAGVQFALQKVGSIQNIALTRLARSKTILFAEDEYDFLTLRRFARRLGLRNMASGTNITFAPSEGFSRWKSVKDFAWGLERSVGTVFRIGAVFDRDYWPEEEIENVGTELKHSLKFVHIHRRKEIENYFHPGGTRSCGGSCCKRESDATARASAQC